MKLNFESRDGMALPLSLIVIKQYRRSARSPNAFLLTKSKQMKMFELTILFFEIAYCCDPQQSWNALRPSKPVIS